MTSTETGRVVSVIRYPVKSMMGEEVNGCAVTERGLLGDRALALVDVKTGKVVSAKNPKKWPTMFDYRATFTTPPENGVPLPPVRVTLSDGRTVTTDSAAFAGEMSAALGREVTLLVGAPPQPSLEELWLDMPEFEQEEKVTDEAMPAGTFFDLATVHLLTTATIDRLRQLCPSARFEPRRFRPNLVIRTGDDEADFIENKWVGQTVRIGDQLVVTITDHCPRCVMTTLPQGDLPKDRDVLRTAVRHNDAHVGVYAEVREPGMVRRGDTVIVG